MARTRRCVASSIEAPSVIITARSPSGEKRMVDEAIGSSAARTEPGLGGAAEHQLENPCVDEAFEQMLIEHPLGGFHLENVECSSPRNRAFVRTVTGLGRVNDVRDGNP